MNSAPFVAGQAGALKCTANADDAHDDVAVIFVDSHTTVPKGEVHGVSRLRRAKGNHSARMTKKVKRPSRMFAGETTLCLLPSFSFIDDWKVVSTGSYGDCRRFTVTERRASGNKAAKQSVLALVQNDKTNPTCSDQVLNELPAPLGVARLVLQFRSDDLRHDDLIRQRIENAVPTSTCVEVDQHACIENQRSRIISWKA